MNIDIIAGARPNFVKIAGLFNARSRTADNICFRLIHTGQHYSYNLSESFFKDLGLPKPDINLKIGSGTQAQQTASLMIAYEKVLEKNKPKLCIVVGDVNSSMACAITAKKMKVPVCHIEAGLRSFDWKMPEEVNRILIDSISDYFFTTTRKAKEQLLKEGKSADSVFFVGNIMIDSLMRFKSAFKKPIFYDDLELNQKKYLVLTMHRPANVDNEAILVKILDEISVLSKNLKVIFPVHPRTEKMIDTIGFNRKNLHLVPPMEYLEFNYLIQNSLGVITDSGGITEETTVLGIPCLTLRDNTERPETIEIGTNELIGTYPEGFGKYFEILLSGKWKKGDIPEKWDGDTGRRIRDIINTLF